MTTALRPGAPPGIAPEDFLYVSAFVRRRSAIVLEVGKEYLVEARLDAVVKLHGLTDLATLVSRLRVSESSALGNDVVEALTTNETSFFRDVHPFETLRDEILPALVANRRHSRRLRIWCGAASTGQEPYTVAMVCKDDVPDLAGWDVSMLATDLSTQVLERAEKGRYSNLEVNRGLPATRLVRWFTRDGAGHQVSDELRSMIRFAPHNLIGPPPPEVFDLVMLRNVLIYFSEEDKRKVLSSVVSCLAPDGFVVLGGSETAANDVAGLVRERVGRTVVYRRDTAPARRDLEVPSCVRS